MRIAYITYEYPPDIAQGGIATYTEQAAKLMKSRGHEVEIFCGSPYRMITEVIDGVLVHRIKTENPSNFTQDCLDIFSQRHINNPFQIFETPEIHGNALLIKKQWPNVPMVVKLHTPLFLQMKIYNYYASNIMKLRFFLGSLKRGKPRKYGQYNYKIDVDYQLTNIADSIVSPSRSLKKIISKYWKINERSIGVIPSPFIPSPQLLKFPINKGVQKKITFIGKLNVHKGIINLVKVIKLTAQKHPDVRFELIGNDSFWGTKKISMTEYVRRELKQYDQNYKILGGMPYNEILNKLSQTEICIFPSIWDNFPLVCLEAMSAGCAVVGSKEGGMCEMLSDGVGILVDPHKPQQLENALDALITDPNLRHNLGERARAKVINNFNSNIIGRQIETHFQKVISTASNYAL